MVDLYKSVAGRPVKTAITQDDIGDGSTNKAYTATEQSKLGGIIAAASPLNRHPSLVRTSATRLTLSAPGANFLDEQYALVNGLKVDLSTAKTVDVSGGSQVHTLAADGTDSGSDPAVSTLYYIYLGNASSSFRASEMGLSATAPTNGYLATSGNGRNYRFVGAAYLSDVGGAAQVVAEYNLAGFQESTFTVALGSNIDRSSGAAQTYDVIVFDNVVILPGFVQANSQIRQISTAVAVISNAVYIDTATQTNANLAMPASTDTRVQVTITQIDTTIRNLTVKSQYYYQGSGDHTVISTNSSTTLMLWRAPLQ
jgi:hypothetical protein